MRKVIGIVVAAIGTVAVSVWAQSVTKTVGQPGAATAPKDKFAITQVGFGKTAPIADRANVTGAPKDTYKVRPITNHAQRATADCAYVVITLPEEASMYVSFEGEGTRLCDAAGNKYKAIGVNNSDGTGTVDLHPNDGNALGFILEARNGRQILVAFDKPTTGTQFTIKGLVIDRVKRDNITVTLP